MGEVTGWGWALFFSCVLPIIIVVGLIVIAMMVLSGVISRQEEEEELKQKLSMMQHEDYDE